jgi:hypothetical protein
MTTRNLVAVRIWGGTVRIDPADPDDTEAAIAAYLSSVNVESETAASFARSAAGLISGFEFDLCDECTEDLDRHEIGPDMFGLAHAWCLKCPECGMVLAGAAGAMEHAREGL